MPLLAPSLPLPIATVASTALSRDTSAAVRISDQLGRLAASSSLTDAEFTEVNKACIAMMRAKALLLARLETRDGDTGASELVSDEATS